LFQVPAYNWIRSDVPRSDHRYRCSTASGGPGFLHAAAGRARRTHARRIAWRLRGEHGLGGRPLAEDRLHVKLCGVCPFGRLTCSAAVAIRDAAATVAMPPFRLGFDRVESFRTTSSGR